MLNETNATVGNAEVDGFTPGEFPPEKFPFLMDRETMRLILARPEFRGVKRAIAATLEVTHAAVSLWLAGKCNSTRIEHAVTMRVRELLLEARGESHEETI